MMVVVTLILYDKVIGDSAIENLYLNVNESDEFRRMNLSEKTINQLRIYEEKNIPVYKALSVLMIRNDYDLSNIKKFPNENELIEEYKRMNSKRLTEFQQVLETYKSVFSDLEYFPVAESDSNNNRIYSYVDSWMAERLYGGKRGHEGCDIMAGVNQRGLYPIVSVSDGVVEKMGWLEKGGWRIGIRSNSGAYFYYAHLSGYEEDIKVGDKIEAGTIIGYMGDSGYGEEGTVGNFNVHLHFGIYIATSNYEEISVNPYWILKMLEENRLLYSY